MIAEQTEIGELSKYTLRPATIADLSILMALFDAWGHHFYGRSFETIEHLQHQFESSDWNASESSRVILAPDGAAVAFVEVWDTHPVPVRPHIWFCIRPGTDHYEQIGRMLMDWAKARAMQAIERIPEDVRFVLQSGTDSIDSKQAEVITAAGMEPTGNSFALMVRHFEADEALAEPQWPDGITVTTAEVVDDLRAIHRAVHDAFRDHRGAVEADPESSFRRWSERMTTNPQLDKSLWFLAMDGDQIVGISLCEAKSSDYPDQGYVDQLGVTAPYRRQGIARALLRHSFCEFQRRGMAGANLRVDEHSLTGANYLYTSEGMVRDSGYNTYTIEIRPGRELSKQ